MSEAPQATERRTRRGKAEAPVVTNPTRADSVSEPNTKLTPAQYDETGHEDLPAQYEF